MMHLQKIKRSSRKLQRQPNGLFRLIKPLSPEIIFLNYFYIII